MITNKTKQIKQLHDMQKKHLENIKDDYSVGIYNGLELALAICEKREPMLVCAVKETEVFETSEEKRAGKTKYSGVRRR